MYHFCMLLVSQADILVFCLSECALTVRVIGKLWRLPLHDRKATLKVGQIYIKNTEINTVKQLRGWKANT